MPVQELIDRLAQVGKDYPVKTNTIWDKVRIWDKHDNQLAANQLMSITSHVEKAASEKLQEVQVLLGLVRVLNTKDFVYSTKLITDIKKVLSDYPSFYELDVYLPEKSDKTCPNIKDLREALTKLGELLRNRYETARDVDLDIKKALNA